MSDLISREDACEAVKNEMESWLKGDRCDYRNVVDAIMDLPSAEPEIIRCKDCKHWYKDADSGMSCEYTEMSQPEDGFCNWAERRGDSNDRSRKDKCVERTAWRT